MGLLERMDKNRVQPKQDAPTAPADDYKDLRETVHREVVELINRRAAKDEQSTGTDEIRPMLDSALEVFGPAVPRPEKNRIARELYDEICGFGPLEPLLADSAISEIMVNGHRQVYVERSGRLSLSNVTFRDEEHVRSIIDRIISPLGRHIDEANPMVDARLPDGSRVNAIIPPLSLKGAVVTIRKFSKTPLKIQDLISFGSLSMQMAAFLEACVRGRLNIVVSGGTGSGKTTLLNVLSAFIPEDERIVTIEDAAELQLCQAHVLTLESRPPNLEGKGAVTIRDLVRNALRMRPDRI
ncbi:MAG TPA: ATPase, T2SS/T4P/T4SS family, partial [Pseudoflavonifractor sp.]|nr:ATPase, T2SS/T4P/T4SS family [Pseudoflavonifractor sp.]